MSAFTIETQEQGPDGLYVCCLHSSLDLLQTISYSKLEPLNIRQSVALCEE